MTMTYAQIDRVYSLLRDERERYPLAKQRRERAIALIKICIANGFDTRWQIVKALGALRLSKDHVRKILDDHTIDLPGLAAEHRVPRPASRWRRIR